MSIRITHIRTLSELDAIKEIWINLERVEGGPSVFQSWTWNRIWCEQVLNSRKQAHLAVRVVEDGAGRPVAILPFFEEPLLGPMARLTQFLGHQMSEHNDILLVDPQSAELADEVIYSLFADLSPVTILHLRNLNGESMFTKRLLAQGCAEPHNPLVYLQNDPKITDQAMRLGYSERKSLRKAEHRLRRQFEIQFRVRSGADFLEAFDEMIDLHNRRFAAKGHSTTFIGPSLVFLRTATAALSNTGQFEIVQLRANDATIAAKLTAYDKRRYFLVQGGFDPGFSRFAPMRVLQNETIRRGFEDLGCEILDMGTAHEQYKFDWAPIVATNYMCCRGGAGPYAKLAANCYRAAFRRRLRPLQGSQPP